MSDQMDLLVEQVKMLAGEIAFSTSTLKRLVEQSVNEPDSSKTQVDLSFFCLEQHCTLVQLS
jgi:centromeric protein E